MEKRREEKRKRDERRSGRGKGGGMVEVLNLRADDMQHVR